MHILTWTHCGQNEKIFIEIEHLLIIPASRAKECAIKRKLLRASVQNVYLHGYQHLKNNFEKIDFNRPYF